MNTNGLAQASQATCSPFVLNTSFIRPKSMQQTFFSEPPDDAGCLTALHMPQDVWMCTSTTWCQHFFVCVGGMFCMNSDTNSAFCSMIEIL